MYKDDVHGYLVECDIEYPNDLHNEHNGLPCLSERNIFQKSKYICNLDMLRQAEDHSLIVTNYHRIIKF